MDLYQILFFIVIVSLPLQIAALLDVYKNQKTGTLNVFSWVLIIVILELIGPILYYAFGKAKI